MRAAGWQEAALPLVSFGDTMSIVFTLPAGDSTQGALNERRSSVKQNGSVSQSASYDYSGQDVAHKKADELSSLSASRTAALMQGDLESSLATGRRIADLRSYLDVYRNSGGRGGWSQAGEVLPGARVSSTGGTASTGYDVDHGVSFHDPYRQEKE